jgi:hypothetical protein
MYTAEFADFGYFGVVLALMKIDVLAYLIALNMVSGNFYKSEKSYYLYCSILVLPTFYFHMPLIFSFILYFILVIRKK